MDNKLIDELIGLVIGLILVILGFSKKKQRHELLEKGIKTEGVVFSVEKKYTNVRIGNIGPDGFDNSPLYYPVIRYTTLEKEWITEEYGIGTSYSIAYKEGDKVKIVYDPNKTTTFIIDDGSTLLIGPILIVIGVIVMIAALVYYLFPNLITHS